MVLSSLSTEIVDGDKVLVGAEPAHRLRFAHHAFAADLVEPFRADGAERDFAVEAAIVGEVDALTPALAEETADGIAASDERCGERDLLDWRRCRGRGRSRWSGRPEVRLGGAQEYRRVLVFRVHGEDGARLLGNFVPAAGIGRCLRLVEEALDTSLDSFTDHELPSYASERVRPADRSRSLALSRAWGLASESCAPRDNASSKERARQTLPRR